MKNSSDTIGNRTRDLPGYSALPQPSAPPRAPGRVNGLSLYDERADRKRHPIVIRQNNEHKITENLGYDAA
jgi:hypothetical protein